MANDHLYDEFHIGKFKPDPTPIDGQRLAEPPPRELDRKQPAPDLLHSKLDAILALLGSVKYDIQLLTTRLNQIEHTYLLTPEKKVEMFERAKKQYEKLREESDAEIDEILKRRSERGIPDGGDRVTEDDIRDLDRHEA